MEILLQGTSYKDAGRTRKSKAEGKTVVAAVQLLSHVCFFETPWTVARQAPLSMGFSRHEYWRGLPCPPPGNLPNLGSKPTSPVVQADSLQKIVAELKIR